MSNLKAGNVAFEHVVFSFCIIASDYCLGLIHGKSCELCLAHALRALLGAALRLGGRLRGARRAGAFDRRRPRRLGGRHSASRGARALPRGARRLCAARRGHGERSRKQVQMKHGNFGC